MGLAVNGQTAYGTSLSMADDLFQLARNTIVCHSNMTRRTSTNGNTFCDPICQDAVPYVVLPEFWIYLGN